MFQVYTYLQQLILRYLDKFDTYLQWSKYIRLGRRLWWSNRLSGNPILGTFIEVKVVKTF